MGILVSDLVGKLGEIRKTNANLFSRLPPGPLANCGKPEQVYFPDVVDLEGVRLRDMPENATGGHDLSGPGAGGSPGGYSS